MEATEPRSNAIGPSLDHDTLDSLQFNEEVQHFMAVLPENANSLTALLQLRATQGGELLHHSPESNDNPAPNLTLTGNGHHTPYHFNAGANLTFPSNIALIERAARFSVSAGEHYNHHNNNNNYYDNNNNNNIDNSNTYAPETTGSVPSNSRDNLWKTNNESPESDSSDNPNSSQQLDIDTQNERSAKRKEREKAKPATKKSKSGANYSSEEAEKLPYVHVRARRGQATDSHSLAERARRAKINARMKLLQELVPGCSKISGTTVVLDEIINHVQLLQRQVEVLSMRLAAVNPEIDFNLDSILAAESGSLMDSKFPSIVIPVTCPEVQVNGSRQQYQQQWHFDGHQPAVWGSEEESHNFVTRENFS